MSRGLTRYQVEQVLSLVRQGFMAREITRSLGVPTSAIYKVRQGRYRGGVDARRSVRGIAAPQGSPGKARAGKKRRRGSAAAGIRPGTPFSAPAADAALRAASQAASQTGEAAELTNRPKPAVWCARCRCHVYPPCVLCKLRPRLSAARERAAARSERDRERAGREGELRRNIAELPLPVRLVNMLHKRGIATVEDLLQWTPERLLQIPCFAEGSLDRVFRALEFAGFSRRAG